MSWKATDIPGWITQIDLAILTIVSSYVPPNTKFIEIGSWVGRSTTAIAEGLDPSIELHAVDIWSTETIPPNKLDRNTCMATSYMPYNSTIYKNYIDAIEIANNENSWQPAFSHFVKNLNVVKHCCSSNDFQIPEDWSAVFIDGDHSTEQLQTDIVKFLRDDYLDSKLVFGDDYCINHADTVPQALLESLNLFGNIQMYAKRRFLIRFPKSELWFMWPSKGYWYECLPSIFDEVNNAVAKIRSFPVESNVNERAEHPTAYINSILPKS